MANNESSHDRKTEVHHNVASDVAGFINRNRYWSMAAAITGAEAAMKGGQSGLILGGLLAVWGIPFKSGFARTTAIVGAAGIVAEYTELTGVAGATFIGYHVLRKVWSALTSKK